ncbi:substrate-binding domain-containing protein [uncultured Microbacterium sp.]|uniref:LacI family DNA-binding transcriptional regulator n=1 Tax=uncultured Microbacterium sp. TaxID=191216 RepID=UPI00262A9D8C|nr:substrate-binding domain-containing protein [uncultured Microbacterium sp.]
MGRPPADASLRSLAKALDLSTATVSNAFNRPDRVAAATLARIRAEAERIGYGGPDPAARQLRRGRADAVGLVLTDELPFAFEDHAAVGFLAGLAQACEETGRSLVMLPSGSGRSSVLGGALRTAADAASGSAPGLGTVAIDGVIVYSVGDHEPLLDAARARRLPIVVVDQPHPDAGWGWVGIDDAAVGFAVGEHLARLGHRRVGVVAPRLSSIRRNGPVLPGVVSGYAVLRARIDGLREGLESAAGQGAVDLAVEERTISSERAGAEGFEALMMRHPELTAVFCLSDELALGALTRAEELGMDVPGRVSIVGVDDIERAAPAGLTTVEQPLQAKGAVAGRILMARIDERLAGVRPGPTQATVLPTTLHVRRSTGPVPVGG